jgi:hypothetical protein
VGGYFAGIDVFMNEPARPTRFFSPWSERQWPETRRNVLNRLHARLLRPDKRSAATDGAVAKKNGVVFNGPMYNIYLFDEMSVTDPEQYLLQTSASVKEIRRAPSHRPLRRL